MIKKKKKILLVVGGGISAYKSLDLIRLLKKNNFQIKTVLTKGGKQFVTPLSLVSLSGGKVYDELFNSSKESEIDHISLSRWADLIIVVPATANFISKYANGLADNLLLSTLLMFDKEIYVAPAMHEEMFMDNKIQSNIIDLSDNVIFCGPRYGNLDIGDKGLGRLIEPIEMFDILFNKKEKVIVTSGPTSEYLDDVRAITNKSSGKQGRAVAIELMSLGYDVVYIHSKTISPVAGAKNISFDTSKELQKAMNIESNDTKHLYMVAAVSDFIPEKVEGKMKRTQGSMTLNLSPNVDIVKEYKEKYKMINVISFSAQTNDDLNFEKINVKNSDFLVINNINDISFGSDTNKVTIINKKAKVFESEEKNKHIIAQEIIKNTLI